MWKSQLFPCLALWWRKTLVSSTASSSWGSYACHRHFNFVCDVAYPQPNLLPSKSGTEEASALNQIILLLDILLIYRVSDLARKIQNQLDFNIWNLQMIDCLFSPNIDLLNLEDFKCCQAILSNTCILMTYCALKSTKWFYTHNTINPYNDNEWLLFCFFNI